MEDTNFYEAIIDYSYLLEKNYPQKSILKLIGDKYMLNRVQRTILYRGITTSEKSKNRNLKLIKEDFIKSEKLYIDCYNVIYTIGSYLNGNTLFVGTDNLLRDASEIHGKILRTKLLDRSLNLLFGYLKTLKIAEVILIIDEPVNHSKSLCKKINELIKKIGIKAKAEINKSPDIYLKTLKEGICATSDSVIIDKSNIKIFDLARNTLNFHFSPEFLFNFHYQNPADLIHLKL
ncbi:MAG: DUF434 domain-containing protein [Bacteroidales bacterium]|nr:DUF434 domain-containing protein [Bacteroidales bacterium]